MSFDIFMITYGEPNAAENWARLQSIAPQAQRIDNVRGMTACYVACAMAARTTHFFSVDGDNWILDDFRFEVPFDPAPDEIALWCALNPINGLRYGNGAVKLYPTKLVKAPGLDRHLDFAATAARSRYTAICASEHRFNADPYSTWAAAFRECAKLGAFVATLESEQQRALPQHWLSTWCTKGAKAKFGEWCLKGAREGRLFGEAHSRDRAGLEQINDFEWLRARFRERHVRKIAIPPRA